MRLLDLFMLGLLVACSAELARQRWMRSRRSSAARRLARLLGNPRRALLGLGDRLFARPWAPPDREWPQPAPALEPEQPGGLEPINTADDGQQLRAYIRQRLAELRQQRLAELRQQRAEQLPPQLAHEMRLAAELDAQAEAELGPEAWAAEQAARASDAEADRLIYSAIGDRPWRQQRRDHA